MAYDHKALEAKWQKKWEEAGIFHAEFPSKKDPYYLLIEFPYPSGSGLHVGHPRSFTALDVIARKRRMEGFNVLYPIGWDAFGLPTENFAIKTGRKPQDVTAENIANFKRQLQSLGISFDWSREVNTTDPSYYKWTQWQFLQFFKAGLAYKKSQEINWCVDCKIGLANEEVVDRVCERCGGKVEKREKEQWMIAITKYAERLLEDLGSVDYLPKIKKQQEDWIGKSEGAEIDFEISPLAKGGQKGVVKVFTTRPDTIFVATYLVLAPEHPLVLQITNDEYRKEVENYIAESGKKSDIERGDDTKEKTGVFTGAYALNPASGEKIPVWVADYVLGHYGTGAIMAVPAHDERDRAFAEVMHLPISDQPLIPFEEALQKSGGVKTTKYKLRDWVFSRQRYWGEPIPLVHCENDCSSETGGWVSVPESDLPVLLPEVEAYQPSETGESPLANITEWVNTTCPTCGGKAKRETDTMPNWAGSSWYFLRYADAHNVEAFAGKKALDYWMPIDWYNGGMEHTTLHLLYSRFWNKVLFDLGYVPVSEPYQKRTSHGLVLAEDGSKMSKSKGNVVNPDEIVVEFGADTLRLYELFMGPFAEPVPWSTNGVIGVRRFLEKVIRLSEELVDEERESVTRALHRTIQSVSEDVEAMRFNTAVASLMTFVNEAGKAGGISRETFLSFLTVLAPFAPHLANELYEKIGGEGFLESLSWPKADEELAREENWTIAVQVNGKLRASIEVARDTDESEVIAEARKEENVAKYLIGEPKKTIYIHGKLINFVI